LQSGPTLVSASMSTKRGYSREFTPRTERRVTVTIDRIPPTLLDAVKAKAKREGVSLRALILSLLKDWLQR
jgi:predicted DNA binding CopG/RHH family protein